MSYVTSRSSSCSAIIGVKVDQSTFRLVSDWSPPPKHRRSSNDVCMYGHHMYSRKGKDRPGKVTNFARGQLDRENACFPDRVRA